MPQTSKTKAGQKRIDAALHAFHARYVGQYGEKRWHENLFPALQRPTSYVAMLNRFIPRAEIDKVFEHAGVLSGQLRGVLVSSEESLLCYERAEQADSYQSTLLPFPPPTRVEASSPHHQLNTHYNLDAASVLCALLLAPMPGDRVLDLCAAPGGKSIVLSQLLFPQLYHQPSISSALIPGRSYERTCLHVNEADPARHKRLVANLRSYLPPSLFGFYLNPLSTQSSPIQALNLDASIHKSTPQLLPHGPNGYDKILVDAPCSSERHIIHAHISASRSGRIADELLNWKPSHSTTLAKTQLGILLTAIRACKVGGRIVYATCALGSEENDGVVERAVEHCHRERALERKRQQQQKAAGGFSTRQGEWTGWTLRCEMGGTETPEQQQQPAAAHQEEAKQESPRNHGLGETTPKAAIVTKTEPTKYGRIALPDKGGWGPLYFCVIEKAPRPLKSSTPVSSAAVAAASE